MTTPTPDQIRDFVIAGHFDLAKIQSMLAENPELLNAAQPWSETDHETAIMAAAQTGNRAIAEYLISQGAPVDICTAAMLGQRETVDEMLSATPGLINTHGAHGIPLLAYAAMSGNLELVQSLYARGAGEGVSFALHNAVNWEDESIVRWLLENTSPDLTWKNWQEKTALMVALENGNTALAELLRQHGATE
jgi:ankyrin repeat protein